MFNYYNLNDVEFEELCKDIMEKLLRTKLRIFAKGRDGGVDLTDNTVTHNVVVQVKHYINSKFANLMATMKKEVNKVKDLNPKQYYICCGMKLTDGNVRDIYSIFSSYMDSDRNIITLKEVDEFLQKPENIDIVRKHYKLWLYASNILSEICNQDIFIDCESLLSDIDDDCKYFVQTTSYEECLKCLESNRIIMMIGAPGVGKTVTSKMLVFYFASKGFRVRYTTNGDISNVKRSLSSDSSVEEIILLDDCLGQHYFNMKNTQENELISLIKYIKLNPKKVLILNSRITILNEAKERSEEFKIFLQGDKIKIHTINMNLIGSVEKAKIFYNHLVFKNVPREYYNDIRKDRKYLRIVNHANYTPRIIEYITNSSRYLTVPPNEYGDYILATLEHPDDIWNNEFVRRLQDKDRALMSTLYSLTDTSVDYDVLRKCFNNRLSQMENIDNTINIYEMTLARLNGSIISVFDNKGKMHIGAINPSINDYLKMVLQRNNLELSAVKNAILYYVQILRCYTSNEAEEIIQNMVMDGSILGLNFDSDFEKEHFIVSKVCQYSVRKELYTTVIIKYFTNIAAYNVSIKGLFSINKLITCLAEEPLYTFYRFVEIMSNEDIVNNVFMNMTLEELVDTIETLYRILEPIDFQINALEWFIPLSCNALSTSLKEYVEDIDASSYYENYDIEDLIKQNYTQVSDCDYEFDEDNVVDTIKEFIEDEVKAELKEMISRLPIKIQHEVNIERFPIHIDRNEIEGAIRSFFEPDIDRDDDYRGSSNVGSIDVIDAIFDRDK